MVADATQELGDLVKMSDKAIGAKQSAQIGNRISAVKVESTASTVFSLH